MINCDYTIPFNSEGNPPAVGEIWNYSHASCTQSSLFLLQNPETGAEFYLQKTMSYGDLLLIIFVSIFLVWGIVRFLWNFVYERK